MFIWDQALVSMYLNTLNIDILQMPMYKTSLQVISVIQHR